MHKIKRLYTWWLSMILVANLISFLESANHTSPQQKTKIELVSTVLYKKGSLNYIAAKQTIQQHAYFKNFLRFNIKAFIIKQTNHINCLIEVQNKLNINALAFNTHSNQLISSYTTEDEDHHVSLG